jgi:hypothetical protein
MVWFSKQLAIVVCGNIVQVELLPDIKNRVEVSDNVGGLDKDSTCGSSSGVPVCQPDHIE